MATKKKKMPLWKENKIEYTANYNKENYKNISFKLKKDEVEVLEKLNSVGNKSTYIIGLIKADIEKERGN